MKAAAIIKSNFAITIILATIAATIIIVAAAGHQPARARWVINISGTLIYPSILMPSILINLLQIIFHTTIGPTALRSAQFICISFFAQN